MSPAALPMEAVVIGAGPAGLMAAEMLAGQGIAVDLFEAMPSPARKFLRAGIGGLNLTHSQPFARFLAAYGAAAPRLEPMLAAFGPDDLRAWAAGLGIETFVGSSGRVFPVGMKAAPLLRAWLNRLGAMGVRLHARRRWLGWDGAGHLRFAGPESELLVRASAVVLALGGASWPRLGSDGAWTGPLGDRAIAITALAPANCGFDCDWSAHFSERHGGQPVKSVGLRFGERRLKGEFVITTHGVEGSAIYALSAPLRDAIAQDGEAVLLLDLKPDWPPDKLARALAQPQGSRSLATHWHRTIGLDGVAAALAREVLPASARLDAAALKAVPLCLRAPRPLAEAISTAGGVDFAALDGDLMVAAHPGLFIAGEMLDWEAPTGGYLLTGCLATGRAAGLGAAKYLAAPPIGQPPSGGTPTGRSG